MVEELPDFKGCFIKRAAKEYATVFEVGKVVLICALIFLVCLVVIGGIIYISELLFKMSDMIAFAALVCVLWEVGCVSLAFGEWWGKNKDGLIFVKALVASNIMMIMLLFVIMMGLGLPVALGLEIIAISYLVSYVVASNIFISILVAIVSMGITFPLLSASIECFKIEAYCYECTDWVDMYLRKWVSGNKNV